MNEGHYAVDDYMVPLGPGQSSHHLPVDHIIKVSGDKAHFNAQFVVFQVQNAERPESGWPAGALGAQGTVTPSRPAITIPTFADMRGTGTLTYASASTSFGSGPWREWWAGRTSG